MNNNCVFKKKNYNVDFCVIGGGLAGMFSAISAARNGAKVVLIHDRPVLGGNASSEIRMWVGGAAGSNNRETGILEEISLENLYRNPYKIYSIWDSILYEKVKSEKNITLLLNCSCNDAEMDGDTIKSITGWQLTTQTYHTIEAKIFADCSGDSILAPLTGAEHRWGREASSEFNEDIAPEHSDKKTMGLSCLIQARETNSKRSFIPPVWANKYTKEDLPYRVPNMKSNNENYWYMELGGTQDTIHDAEELRDELLKVAFGVWDYIKNSGDFEVDNWELDWVGFLPGKRENRRYVGDHILTQNDVRAEGKFDDLVGYGGWSMDDHHPEGIKYPGKPTIFHQAPSPYGIPYRCLYSKNINNLYFAGRNISATHSAMSSSRVMATCAILGQAVGTAAAMAVEYDLSPREIYEKKINELKQELMDKDCYLPFNKRVISNLSLKANIATSNGDGDVLINGLDRPIEDIDNGWTGEIGGFIQYNFEEKSYVNNMRIIFDSDLDRVTVSDDYTVKKFAMGCNVPLNQKPIFVPPTIVKEFSIEALDENSEWKEIKSIENNYQRYVSIPLNIEAKAVRVIFRKTWGLDSVHVFACEVN